MPRQRNNLLRSFFSISKDPNVNICNREKCNGKVVRSLTRNLERHLKAVHPETYTDYMEKQELLLEIRMGKNAKQLTDNWIKRTKKKKNRDTIIT